MARDILDMKSVAASAATGSGGASVSTKSAAKPDIYFSVDVETDGPIPGEFSMLSFAFVLAGQHDGNVFKLPPDYDTTFETTLRPISERFDQEALDVNRLDRDLLLRVGRDPESAMAAASEWIKQHADGGTPILVAYPLSFDWSWLYWYFVRFTGKSPFNHSRCFDLKTAIAVRGHRAVSESGHDKLPDVLRSTKPHTHRALDDAIEQAEILAKFFAWDGS